MTIVFVHGSPGEGRSWGRVAKHLPPKHTLLTPNLPGYGGSPPLKDDVEDHTTAMARPVIDVIASEPLPVWLVGHSYGGNVALHAAMAQPEKIRGLVLFEPVFFRGLFLAGDSKTLMEAGSFFEDYIARVERGEPLAVSRMIDFWFGTGSFATMPSPVQQFLDGAAPKNAADVRGSFGELVSREQLATLTFPVRIVTGGASPPVIEAIACALAALLPDALVEEMPGATHGMLDSHPGQVAAVIDTFCR